MTFSVLLACPGPHTHTSLQRWALTTCMLRRASFATRLGYRGFSLQRHMCTVTVISTHLLIRGLVEFLHPLEFLLKLAHFVLIHLDLSHNTHTQPVTWICHNTHTTCHLDLSHNTHTTCHLDLSHNTQHTQPVTWICHTTHTQPVTWICHTTHTHNLSPGSVTQHTHTTCHIARIVFTHLDLSHNTHTTCHIAAQEVATAKLHTMFSSLI